MKIKLSPENLFEAIAKLSGKIPVPLLDIYYGGAYSKTLITALRLGIIEQLKDGAKPADEIADKTGYSINGIRTILVALAGFDYIKKDGDQYMLNAISKRWLLKNSPESVTDAILFVGEVFDVMNNMEEMIKTGNVPDFHSSGKPEKFWKTYMRSLATFAKLTSFEIAKKAIYRGKSPKRLLDVGGGHGIYSIAFCKRFQDLKADIIDLPMAAKEGGKIVEENGFSDRIDFIEGDMLKTEWNKGYDLILLFNVIHTIEFDESRELIKKAYESLKNGGTLLLLDSENNEGEGHISATTGFNELLFYIITGKCTYPEVDVINWMKSAGFRNVIKRRLLTVPMSLYLNAIK